MVNRGLAILGDTLFMATVDAHLVAIDAKNGQRSGTSQWPMPTRAMRMTLAPLVVKDKVVVGVAGGEFGIRGFISAYDAAPARKPGASTPFPAPASPVMKPGRARLGITAARPPG